MSIDPRDDGYSQGRPAPMDPVKVHVAYREYDGIQRVNELMSRSTADWLVERRIMVATLTTIRDGEDMQKRIESMAYRPETRDFALHDLNDQVAHELDRLIGNETTTKQSN